MRIFAPAAAAMLMAMPICALAQTKPQPAPGPAPPAAQAAAPEPEAVGSLFDETWRQFDLGGRFSSTSGDPARFQRYEDIGSGVLFTNARYAVDRERWSFSGAAQNVGWRDERYAASVDRPGRFTLSGVWDEIPQFYSVDTRTPYTSTTDGVLVLDDATQRAIQNAQANLNAYVPVAGQFDLRESRKTGRIDLLAAATRQLDVRAQFTTTNHSGELPWGASFGFSNDVEVALPYKSRTNDLSVGAEWRNDRGMFRVAYDGSWFENQSDTLLWDSPLRLDDAPEAPGRGRMALWPTNSANTVSGSGYAKFPGRTQVSGLLSFGTWSNDEPLQPFTVNPSLPQLALPRATTDASAQVVSANLSLVSRPVRDWRLSARLRSYDYSNEMPAAAIPQYVSYDSEVSDSLTGGPKLYSNNRTDMNVDATWTALRPFAFTAGYGRNNASYDFRVFESTGENVVYLAADAVGTSWLTFRARYDYGDRDGSGLDEASLVQVGEQPGMRHFDIAARTRNRFTGQVDVTPNELWTFGASAGLGQDHFAESEFGLQEANVRTFALTADYAQPDGWGGGISYTYERYFGIQESRSASPGEQAADPRRNWTADSEERVDYLLVYLTPPRFGNTEARVSYDHAFSRGNYLYTVVPGGPLPPPSQLPEVFNKIQELKLDIRHRLSNRLGAMLSYMYEPFRVYDFAFDPSVVNGIVQPSSLVLGYVYRPYTAHSVFAGLRYRW